MPMLRWVPVVVLPLAQQAVADELDTLNFVAIRNMRHETNIFRLSSSRDERAVLGGRTKSEDITTTAVGLKINKPYSLQRFELDLSYVDTNYRKFDYLSFGALNYRAQWNWSLTPAAYGTVSRLHREQQASFLDYTGVGNRNVTTVDVTRADSTFELDGAWKLLAGVTEVEVSNERLIVQESDFKQTSAEFGIKRDFRSGSSLSFTSTQGRGSFFKRTDPDRALLIDTGFHESRNDLRAIWSVSAKSSIDAHLGYLSRKHDNLAQRDFNGGVGGIAWRWEPSAKTEVVAGWERNISSFQSTNSSYIARDTFSISPTWRISNKTTLRLRYEHQARQFLGQGPELASILQQDTIDTGRVTLDWKPLRELTVSGSVQSDRRASNLADKDFKNIAATISVQLGF